MFRMKIRHSSGLTSVPVAIMSTLTDFRLVMEGTVSFSIVEHSSQSCRCSGSVCEWPAATSIAFHCTIVDVEIPYLNRFGFFKVIHDCGTFPRRRSA